jgi:hypothetical protein
MKKALKVIAIIVGIAAVAVAAYILIKKYVDSKKVVIGKDFVNASCRSIYSDVVIVGYADSSAQVYANEYNVPFIEMTEFSLFEDLQDSIDVAINKECRLSIFIGGYDQTFEWFRNNQNVYSGIKIDGKSNDYINVNTTNSGVVYYYAKITNWDGSVKYSKICKVNVIDGFVVNATSNDGGIVTYSGDSIVDRNTNITYYFYPNEGYYLKGIKVDKVPLHQDMINEAISNGYTFKNVTEDHKIEVTFAPKIYTIIVDCSAGGIVNVDRENVLQYGEDLEVKFLPKEGYYTKTVKVDGEEMGSIISYLFSDIKCDHEVVVEYEIIKYNLHINSNYGGGVSSNGNVLVDYGSDFEIIITPYVNYGISNITVNGVNVDVESSITIEDITEDTDVLITFAKAYKVESISNVGGNISPTQMVIEGDNLKINIIPDEGYRIKNVIVDNVNFGSIASYTFASVSEEHVISVEFEIKKFNIAINCEGDGSFVCLDGIKNVEYGSDRTIIFNPKDGWKVKKVFVNGVSAEVENNKITINNIDKDMSIQVEFEMGKDVVFFGLDKIELIGIGLGLMLALIAIFAIVKAIKSRRF